MNNNTGMLCESGQSALLIIDVQTHLTAIMPAKVLARLQRNMGLLLTAARLLNMPVFAKIGLSGQLKGPGSTTEAGRTIPTTGTGSQTGATTDQGSLSWRNIGDKPG